MLSPDIFTKSIVYKTITPYKKLRDYYRLRADYVADMLGVSESTLFNYERDGGRIPKDVILRMDDFYKCEGELIRYWLKNDPSAMG